MSGNEGTGDDATDVPARKGPSGEDSMVPLGSSGPVHVRMVLVVGSPYDMFLLEEEHRLLDVLRREYSRRDLGYVPVVDTASGLEEAMSMASRTRYDMVVLFRTLPGPLSLEAITSLRSGNPGLQIALIASTGAQHDGTAERSRGIVDHILIWEDDIDLFLTLITLAEDRALLTRTSRAEPLRSAVLVIEGDPWLYGRLLVSAHHAVWDITLKDMAQSLSQDDRVERCARRPMLIGFQKVAQIGLPPWVRISCALAPSFKGKDVTLSVVPFKEGTPVLSHEGLVEGRSVEVMAGDIVLSSLGAEGALVDRGDGKEPLRVEDLRTLEIVLRSLPLDVLGKALEGGSIVGWLMGKGELELSDLLSTVGVKGGLTEGVREEMVAAVRNRRYRGAGGAMKSYDRSKGELVIPFSRIGTGAMGGKARALHFMGRLLGAEFPGMTYDGIELRVPRTVVICTDIFERFLSENKLEYEELERLPDQRIVQAFLSSDLPPVLLGDLRSIIEELGGPIVIRSSSLLEDALFQPFAGIYASVMLSNSQMERDQRFLNLCTAVKYVFASTYLSRARAYIGSTRNDPSSERMSVMVQEVIGKKRGEHFYPAFSGVGRSFDYWPQGDCSASDGCVNMAVGLGKMIVDGGATYRFCPVHPLSRAVPSPSERLASSQRKFFAVRLYSRVKKTDFGEDSQLVLLDIEEAEGHGIIELAASTYSPENDRFYPGTGRSGPRAIDLAPILEEGAFPLAPLVREVLDIGQRSIGGPVEIEFALELEGTTPVFHLLQMRSMVPRGIGQSVDVSEGRGEVVLDCSRCLGNGIFRLNDIIMVRDRELGEGPTTMVRNEVSRLNSILQADGKEYILIGPGRWGSCDPWLGIPVSWSDISGVKVMIETPASGRPIEPSQGSHFFQNITSLRLGYMMLSPEEDARAGWGRLSQLCCASERGPVVHLRAPSPFEVRLDGRKGKGTLSLSSEGHEGPFEGEGKGVE